MKIERSAEASYFLAIFSYLCLEVTCYTANQYRASVGQACDAVESDTLVSIRLDRDACADSCTTNQDCLAFEYDPTDSSGRNCKLFDFVPGTVPAAGIALEPVPRPTNPPPTNPPPTAPPPTNPPPTNPPPTNPPPTNPPPTNPPPTNPPPTNPPPTAPPPTAAAQTGCTEDWKSCATDADCCGNDGCYNFDNFLIKLGYKCSPDPPQIRRLLQYPLLDWISSSRTKNEPNIPGGIRSNGAEQDTNVADGKKEGAIGAKGQFRHRRAQRNKVTCYIKTR